MTNVFTVILAGGSGTRFWPASRRLRPKQLLALGPDPEVSLIAATVRRIEPLCPPERTLIATGEHLLTATREALPWLPPSSFLGEPAARNTAACIAWANAIIRRRDPEALVMVLPSDHHVSNVGAFLEALERALGSAAGGPITTIGLEPTRPETGYGYIERGELVRDGVHRVTRFVEKPDRARAEEYVASGRYLWNGGMFFFRVAAMSDAIARHLPEVQAGLVRIEAAAAEGPERELAATREVFPALPSISIDHGVMEREPVLHVVPAAFGWSDLGSWQTAWELGAKDAQGNVVDAASVVLDGRNNLVQSRRSDGAARVLIAIGVDDLCVVETDDAILVIPRDRAQDVRLAVELLQRRGEGDRI